MRGEVQTPGSLKTNRKKDRFRKTNNLHSAWSCPGISTGSKNRGTVDSVSYFPKEWFGPLHGEGERGGKVVCVCLIYKAGFLVLLAFTFVALATGKKTGPQDT